MRKRGFILMTVCILIVGMLAGCGARSGQDESQPKRVTRQRQMAMEPRGKPLSCIFQLPEIQSV